MDDIKPFVPEMHKTALTILVMSLQQKQYLENVWRELFIRNLSATLHQIFWIYTSFQSVTGADDIGQVISRYEYDNVIMQPLSLFP